MFTQCVVMGAGLSLGWKGMDSLVDSANRRLDRLVERMRGHG